MCACVCVHVFVIDGQSFKPIPMRFKTWVPLISRRVKVKFSHKKSDPPPPQISLNLAKFNRNAFVSSSKNVALVSLHLTALSMAANCSEYRTDGRLQSQFYIAHEPTQYTVDPLPSYQDLQLDISPEWRKIYRVWYQWEALNAKGVETLGGRWQRVTTVGNGWGRVRMGDNG